MIFQKPAQFRWYQIPVVALLVVVTPVILLVGGTVHATRKLVKVAYSNKRATQSHGLLLK